MVRVTGIDAKIIPKNVAETSVGKNQPGRIASTTKLHRANALARLALIPKISMAFAMIGPPNTIAKPTKVNANDALPELHPLSSSKRLVKNARTSKYMNPNVVYITVTGFQPATRRKASNPPIPPLEDTVPLECRTTAIVASATTSPIAA